MTPRAELAQRLAKGWVKQFYGNHQREERSLSCEAFLAGFAAADAHPSEEVLALVKAVKNVSAQFPYNGSSLDDLTKALAAWEKRK